MIIWAFLAKRKWIDVKWQKEKHFHWKSAVGLYTIILIADFSIREAKSKFEIKILTSCRASYKSLRTTVLYSCAFRYLYNITITRSVSILYTKEHILYSGANHMCAIQPILNVVLDNWEFKTFKWIISFTSKPFLKVSSPKKYLIILITDPPW